MIKKIRNKIEDVFNRHNALDLKDLKQYHQMVLENKFNFYYTPNNSDDSSDNTERINNTEIINKIEPGLIGTDIQSQKNNIKLIPQSLKTYHCTCKRNRCLKNYCDCRKFKEVCDETCQCDSCMNIYSYIDD